jgi:hypothetical protein
LRIEGDGWVIMSTQNGNAMAGAEASLHRDALTAQNEIDDGGREAAHVFRFVMFDSDAHNFIQRRLIKNTGDITLTDADRRLADYPTNWGI